MAWPVYWLLEGCITTGIRVVAHDCGHQAFSDYAWVNDVVGFILHSALLVPYFSWKCFNNPPGRVLTLILTYLTFNASAMKGLPWLLSIYAVPLLTLNAFLVAVTYLQHTHPALPYYDRDE
ncbi:hypothetical protein CRG98_018514 [Punica granatum]|uniref:Uncharacterized protein n=1 Tax=Punica granatum TaxID=22663 RepID=A0A2I0JXM3_PUNGR|nr:hypothetical protein CRG98_018514 [Punica granatum]